ncbi:MAG: MarC family protein [Pseudomonadota bacterium]|nr:MarC family protein [Pseudomonadota bacterium]
MELTSLLAGFGKSLLLVLATILPIMNPPAMAPTFLAMTEGASTRMRTALAWRIGRNVALLLIGAMLVGTYVLDFFDISLPIVRVAGGMIVAANAWRLLSASTTTSDSRSELADKFTAEYVRATAFYPLTFPITCGPGSIAAAITVGATFHHPRLALSLAQASGGMVAAVAIGLAVYFTYRFARRLLQPLGETGIIVFLRMSAFILLCVGVQIVWDGASELLTGVLQKAAAR